MKSKNQKFLTDLFPRTTIATSTIAMITSVDMSTPSSWDAYRQGARGRAA